MRLPNGYGSVIKLSGKRRKPYAVRITSGRKKSEKGFIQTYKYLEYFDDPKKALAYLADYNKGKLLPEHQSYTDMPTFMQVYDEWLNFKKNLKKPPSASTLRNYGIAYRRYEPLHQRKFATIRTKDIQDIANTLVDKSDSTVTMAKTVLSQMFEYGIKNDYCEKNYAELVTWEYTNPEEKMHTPFSEDEINQLWNNQNEPFADIMLMMIYTGMRASEFISIERKNVHIKEQYLVGGMKTEAGTDRTIPIHDSILPFFRRYYNQGNRYLTTTLSGKKLSYTNFITNYWKPAVKRLKLNHIPHDTRHTFITLADRYCVSDLCIKLIAGHAVSDITKGTYTHKSTEELLAEINKIPAKF